MKRLGRDADALNSAWEDYRRAPSVHSYEDLMKFVPKGERPEWHQKALAVLGEVDLSSRIDLLVKTKEWDRLAAVVDSASRRDLIALSHHNAGPAATGLTKAHPLPAAKLEVAMALRILEAGKSKYYDAALRSLERARRLMLRNAATAEWETLAEEIRTDHRRKTGFFSGFESLADAGMSVRILPTAGSMASLSRRPRQRSAGGLSLLPRGAVCRQNDLGSQGRQNRARGILERCENTMTSRP